MFPFRPSRAATALLELAEAMLAPDTFERPSDEEASTGEATVHPHRRAAAVDRRRRPAPPRPDQTCLAPITRAAREREASRPRS
ncbi:MAG: hypothetical protein ACTHOE_00360 [Conexibacter sp.]